MGLPKHFEPNKMRSQLYEGIEYKDFWIGKSKSMLDELEHLLIRDLMPASGYRIIDIGCGFGRLADCYLDRFEQVVMLDGSMTLLKQAQEAFKEKAVYIAADANQLPFLESSFDCALMMRVFHHLPNSQFVLEGVKRILGGDGCFIFNYSNKLSPKQLIRKLPHFWRENPLTLEPVLSGKTLIQHHPAYVHQLLIKSGFSQVKYLGAGVMDKIAARIGRADGVLSGKGIAPLLGALKLAPWIICKAQGNGGTSVDAKMGVDDILACPICRDPVKRVSDSFRCRSCGRSYPVENEIVDFRIEV